MNIIGNRKIFFSISLGLLILSVMAVSFFGLRFGIDFTGGTLWQVKIGNAEAGITNEEIRNYFEKDLEVKNTIVYSESETKSFLIRFSHASEEEHQHYLTQLRQKFGQVEELRFDAIGPSVGKELRQRALWAIASVLFGISLYVTFAFRKVSYPVKSWKYGVITLVTLFHDIIIPIGLISVLGHFLGIDVDINFVVAVLVVMGFSVHDTIVVFDRIRENLLLNRKTIDFNGLGEIINSSINQTIARSINTSLTLVLVLLAMFFFGPISLKYFILTILVGVIIGTYSSIFVASPALLISSGVKK